MAVPETGLRFRRADEGDLSAVVALTAEAYAPYNALLGAPPIPVTEDYRPRTKDGEVWLLELDGDLAGLIVLERLADRIEIFSVAVSPRHQGRGFGIRLLAFAEEQARSAGFRRVTLYTNARMERNIAIYAAHGYRETGRRPNPKREGWILVDMEKHI